MSKKENFKYIKWQLRYWCNENNESSVEDWLNELTNEQLKVVAKELKLLELCGNLLKLPHSKSLKEGLFELREQKFGYRIYYSFECDYQIVILQAGNKKTQNRDIKIARKRLAHRIKEPDNEDKKFSTIFREKTE